MSRKTRKLMWSVPMIAAVAVVGALAAFMTLTPNAAQADHVDLPGIVTGVMAEADGRDSVDVTWKAPATGGTPDYYRIDRSGDGDNWMRLVQMHTDGLSYTDMMGLKPNKNYHYRVFAVNAAGTGPSSDLTAHSMTTTDDAVRPGPVRMLTAEVDGPNQINLSWYPPEDNGGSSITRYCISTAMGIADVTGTDGTLLPTAASTGDLQLGGTGLPCAHDTSPGAKSTGDETLTGDDDTSAKHLSAIASGDNSGVIVVRAPEDGAMMVSYMHKKLPSEISRRYEVYAVNSKGMSTTARAVAPIPETEDADKPAEPTLRLVPGGADNTEGVFVPDGSANLYWTWPDNGGKDIISWQLQMKVDGGEWTDVGSATPQVSSDDLNDARAIGEPEYEVTGTDLLPTPATADDTSNSEKTEYRVRAYNGSSGEWSNTVSITITSKWDAGASDSVESTPSTDGVAGLKVSSGEHLRQIDLSWTDQKGTAYLIDYSEVDDDDDNPANDTDREWMELQPSTGYTRSTYNHSSGLDPGVQRHYRVTSLKSGVYGPIMVMNGSTKAATKAAAVEGLKTSSDDPTMIMLEWTKPSEDGGQPITGYRVEIGLDDTFPGTNEIPVTHVSEKCDDIPDVTADQATYVCVREVMGADTTTFTLGGLDAGDDRWFRVFAINKVFTADEDAPNADDVRLADPIQGTSAKSGTPGMPLDLTVQPARDANEDDPAKLGIDILWNAPDDPAGDSVTAYVIARRTKDSTDADWSAWDDDWASISNEGSDFLRTYDTDTDEPDNLANGEMREYKVTAMSGAGSGPTTAEVVYPVDTSHAAIAEPEVGPATDVRTGPFNEGGVIQVNWDAAPNATGYIIYAVNVDELDDADGQIVVAPVNDAAAETFNLGGLNSGDTYDIYVVATAKEMVAWPAAAAVQVTAN